jgi:hypothetical protein
MDRIDWKKKTNLMFDDCIVVNRWRNDLEKDSTAGGERGAVGRAVRAMYRGCVER